MEKACLTGSGPRQFVKLDNLPLKMLAFLAQALVDFAIALRS
jgi:hypothetical protein